MTRKGSPELGLIDIYPFAGHDSWQFIESYTLRG